MLATVEFDPADRAAAAASVVEAWESALVVRMRPTRMLDDVREYYDELVPSLGTPSYLAEAVSAGDRSEQLTGELWTEVRYDPSVTGAYRHSANGQPLHTDGSYVPDYPSATLMCCVSNATEGGDTVFISAEELAGIIARDRPALFEALTSVAMPHARSGMERTSPVLYQREGRWYVNWNYYCVSESIGDDLSELREEFFGYLSDSPLVFARLLKVKLLPGDAVTWKDDEVLHGRLPFFPSRTSERFLWKCGVDIGEFATSMS